MSGAWPPPRDLPDDTNWLSLTHSGTNGVFLIMMALSWWAHYALSPALIVEFDNMVEDVNWVFMTILNLMPVILGKRSHEDETDIQPRKK